MGAFGTGPYQNDDALDILDELITPLVVNINSEIDRYQEHLAKKTSRIDTVTIPALGQFVIDLKEAVSINRLAELSKRIMPLLDDVIDSELNDPKWSRRGDDISRISVLRRIKIKLKKIIYKDSMSAGTQQ